jgi:biotin transport system ATP-binding protein
MELHAQDLGYSIAEYPILQDINISFSTPELAVLAGPNGSGKSLLLQLLSGLRNSTVGQILLDGKSFPARSARLGTQVGLVFQLSERQLLGQTVEEDIRFGLTRLGLSRDEQDKRVEQSISWARLKDHRHQNPHSLSGGEMRRLALASIIAMGPHFLLLDEPFVGLDYQGVQDLLQLLLSLRDQGKGILVVTHSLDTILAHSDRLLIIKEGRIIADGLPERILPHLEDHGIRRPPMKLAEMSWLNGKAQ